METTLSAVFNFGILAGYMFGAFVVGSQIEGTSTYTRCAGLIFFATCGLHHAHIGAFHVLFTPDLPVAEVMTEWYSLWLIIGIQFLAIWGFLIGVYVDLVLKPKRAYSHPRGQDNGGNGG